MAGPFFSLPIFWEFAFFFYRVKWALKWASLFVSLFPLSLHLVFAEGMLKLESYKYIPNPSKDHELNHSSFLVEVLF